MYKRLISLAKKPKRSQFLWGPRQVGKTTLLNVVYPDALRIDLLKSDEFVRFQQMPSLLREIAMAAPLPASPIIMDEVQKVPQLLDEVHWLIENKGLVFVLCGSSARKLKRQGANLLGGRAIRNILLGLSSVEIGPAFDLDRMLNQGNIPQHYDADSNEWPALIRSYVADYLKEEIAAEATVRNLPAFSNFLNSACLSDSEYVNFSRLGSDVGVSGHTIREYFEILEDTYQGTWVQSYSKRPKRRTRQLPKFYFGNIGIVNYLAKRGQIQSGSELFGKAFESFICHELRCHQAYKQPDRDISFWALTTQTEVDFILGDMECAIEVKGTDRVRPTHLTGLRELKVEHPSVGKRLLVCLETASRLTDDGIEIVPYGIFLQRLWNGDL